MDAARDVKLTPILGTPPSLLHLPPGCPFAPRCPMAEDLCREEEPALIPVAGGAHASACHFSSRLEGAEAGDLFKPTTVDAEVLAELEER
jgi:ABC-type antimicrobial peptide transport system ATPase subunit